MNRIVFAPVLLLVTLFVSSCSFYKVVSGKKAKDPDKKVVWTGADTSKTDITIPAATFPKNDSLITLTGHDNVAPHFESFQPILEKKMDYKTFSGKAKMHFEGPDNKVEFTGHFRVRRDSAIWINITAIGGMVQAVCIFITPDSFFMKNYQQEQITKLPLSQADKFLPAKVDFASLQNLILGEPLRKGNITNVENKGDTLIFAVEDSAYLQSILFTKSDSLMQAEHLKTRKPNGPIAETEYSSYFNISDRKISTYRVINLQNGNDIYTLNLNFSKIEFDIPLVFPFSIPDHYTIKN